MARWIGVTPKPNDPLGELAGFTRGETSFGRANCVDTNGFSRRETSSARKGYKNLYFSLIAWRLDRILGLGQVCRRVFKKLDFVAGGLLSASLD